MKLAFCLFNYFPYGGLQRDFLRIARVCQSRGHEIHVYTMKWKGEREPAFYLHLMNIKALQNHTRCHLFIKKLKNQLDENHYDLVIGFNKMPYLDVYYAADVCYQSRIHAKRNVLYRWLPRYRQYVSFEQAVFARQQATEILLISALQQTEYATCYQTETERFHLLTPGIDKDRIAPANAADIREKIRQKYHLPSDHFLLLMVGSGFKTKGLDRSMYALSALPPTLQARCHLFVIGQDKPTSFQTFAKRLQITDRIHFLGGRSDVPHFLLASDLLLHPAYHENTGTVLLEAMVSGLPVLTTDVCGYAHYVREAEAGRVLSSPFQQSEFNSILQNMLQSPERLQWQQNGLTFAKEADIYSLPEKAADLILSVATLKAKKRGFLSSTSA